MSIVTRAGECAEAFDRWLNSQTGKELLEQDAQDQMFRFNLWATNNFVFAPRKASMDWRLRNAPLLESTMIELLDDLKASLIKGSVAQHHVLAPAEVEDQEDMEAINATLDALFRLSRAIRRSGILRRFVKIHNYTEYDENGVNLTAAFRQGAERIIAFRLKDSKATDILKQRVIDTICLRQQHFSYLRAQRSRLYPNSVVNQSQSTSRSTLGATYSATGSLASKARKKTVKAADPKPGAGPSIMTATTAQPARMHRLPSTKSENKGTKKDVDCDDADIPPPPNVPHNLKEMECPYCFLVCPKEDLRGQNWKSHIIQDLMPYFCILDPCLTPSSLFESGKDWLNHMRTQHRTSSWTCMDGAHDTTLFFQSQAGFEDHMHHCHPGQFDEGDLNEIAAACYQQLPEDVMMRECPFCPEDERMGLEPGKMIDHVASHLISLSRISLAGHNDEDCAESEWSGSKRFPSNQLSHSGRIGSLAERLETDFQDQIEESEFHVRQDDDYFDYVEPKAIPEADAEQSQAVWDQIRKPMQDPELDPRLSSFVARWNSRDKPTRPFSGDSTSVEADHDIDTGPWETISVSPDPIPPTSVDSHSATSSDIYDHWAKYIFLSNIMRTPIPFMGERPSECLGNAMSELEEFLHDHAYQKIVQLSLGPLDFPLDFQVEFYVRKHDYKSRIVCKDKQESGQSKDSCLPLNMLEIVRVGSCLELCRRLREGPGLATWANLRFGTIEELVLFFCLFLALRCQDSSRPVKDTQDYELEGEEELFSGEFGDDGYLHDLRIYRDIASGAVRLQASIIEGEMKNAPVWTAFITELLGTRRWIRIPEPKIVMIRGLQPIIFVSSDDSPVKTLQGKYIFRFTQHQKAEAFIHTLRGLAESANNEIRQDLGHMDDSEEQASRPETPASDSSIMAVMGDPPATKDPVERMEVEAVNDNQKQRE